MKANKSGFLESVKKIPLNLSVHTGAWILLFILAFQAAIGHLSVNPVQTAEQRTGKYAVYFLMLTLACTPANIIFGFRKAIKIRRTLGLYSFFFALIHFLIFFLVDYRLDIPLILADVGKKKYILAGAVTMLILLALASTSFGYWKIVLRKNWKRLHRMIYLAGVTSLLHFAWASKGDLTGLQGNILQPALLAVVLIFLLLVRVPFIKLKIIAIRYKILKKSRQARARSIPANEG